MPGDSPTLADLFGLGTEQAQEQVAKDLDASGALWAVEHGLSRAVPPGAHAAASAQLAAALAKLLDIPLIEILAGAWRGVMEFRKCLYDPPGQRRVVAFNRHTVMSEHKPTVDVLLNGQPLVSLVFDVKAGIAFEQAAVVVQDRRFREFRPGIARFEATLGLSDVELLKRTSKDYRLPERLSFGEGIMIGSS
ncbi:MAG: hypothetical protein ACOY71_04075 [Gemmatimonadota bacterium]